MLLLLRPLLLLPLLDRAARAAEEDTTCRALKQSAGLVRNNSYQRVLRSTNAGHEEFVKQEREDHYCEDKTGPAGFWARRTRVASAIGLHPRLTDVRIRQRPIAKSFKRRIEGLVEGLVEVGALYWTVCHRGLMVHDAISTRLLSTHLAFAASPTKRAKVTICTAGTSRDGATFAIPQTHQVEYERTVVKPGSEADRQITEQLAQLRRMAV